MLTLSGKLRFFQAKASKRVTIKPPDFILAANLWNKNTLHPVTCHTESIVKALDNSRPYIDRLTWHIYVNRCSCYISIISVNSSWISSGCESHLGSRRAAQHKGSKVQICAGLDNCGLVLNGAWNLVDFTGQRSRPDLRCVGKIQSCVLWRL